MDNKFKDFKLKAENSTLKLEFVHSAGDVFVKLNGAKHELDNILDMKSGEAVKVELNHSKAVVELMPKRDNFIFHVKHKGTDIAEFQVNNDGELHDVRTDDFEKGVDVLDISVLGR